MAELGNYHGIIGFIKSLFSRHRSSSLQSKKSLSREIHLEPKYWPEVIDYMKNLNELIKSHTISDENIEQVNERITTYILDQINKKGSIIDIEKRYLALDTLADRILVIELGKIVGLKQQEGTRAEFTDITKQFKKRLAFRHEEEKRQMSKNKSSN